MKVLHLSSERTWRGGEQQIAYLLEELTNRHVENVVLARKESAFEKYCQEKNIPVYGLSFRNAIDIGTAKAIKTVCSQHGIDIVHMHSAKSHSLGVLSAAMGNPTPLVLSRRVIFPPGRSWFTRWKYNHRSIRKVICVSDKIKSIMQDYLNEPGKCVTVHSGIDTNKFANSTKHGKLRKELNIPAGIFLVGNTSALEAEKDYPTFIRTIESLAKGNHPVAGVIMGSGSLEGELKKLVGELSLTDRVIFTGHRKDVVEVLADLDCFLMTSTQEGLGTSILDAFAARIPVVATKAGGIPEMVHHEQTGLLGPIGDAPALASNISRLISEPSLRNSLVANAHHTLHEFSKEQMAEKTLAIYREVLAQ